MKIPLARIALVLGLALGACSCSPGTASEAAPPSPQPGQAFDVTTTLRELRDDLAAIEQETDTQLGISLYDGRINGFTGTVATLPSWSSVKVPIARAAQDYCDIDEEQLSELITASIEWSDNAAANSMLDCVGTEHVAKEVARAGADIEVSSAFGFSEWPLASAARYGWYLSTRDEDNEVIVGMHNIVDEQSWGLGALDNAAFKGGWNGDRLDGSWHSRQMGFVRLKDSADRDGAALGIAIAARSPEGSYSDTIDALDKLTAALAEKLD